MIAYSNYGGRLPLGTVIQRYKFGLIPHPAIVVAYAPDGQELVVHNSKDHGRVVVETYAAFAAEGSVSRYAIPRAYDPRAAIERAVARLGQKYYLLDHNCQHFMTDVLYGESRSESLQTAFGLAVAAILIGFLASGNTRASR